MTCIKTGCHIFIECYGEYAYGDAYQVGNVAYFRLVERARAPLQSHLHFTVGDFVDWFDNDLTSMAHPSTLITNEFINHGYEGKPL